MKHLSSILLFVAVLCSQNEIWCQGFEMDSVLRKEVQSNQHYLYSRSIPLSNGCLPFQEGSKWGIRDAKQNIVLPAIYDSLYNVVPGFFAAKNSTSCKLFDGNLWSYLDSTVVDVRSNGIYNQMLVNFTAYKVDWTNAHTEYGVYTVMQVVSPLDPSVKNHATNKPTYNYPFKKKEPNYNSYFIDNAFCDSILYIPGNTSRLSELTFFKNGVETGKITGKYAREHFTKDSIFCYLEEIENDRNLRYRIINLRNFNELFSVDGRDLWCIQSDKGIYLRLETRGENYNSIISIFDLNGVKVGNCPNEGYYDDGFLKVNHEDLSVDLYSFPECKLLYSNLGPQRAGGYGSKFNLFLEKKSKEYLLFYGDKLYYRFKKNKPAYIETSTFTKDYVYEEPSGTEVAVVYEGRKCFIFSSKGMIYQVPKGSNIFDVYADRDGGVTLIYSEDSKTSSYIHGIYSEEKDSILRVPIEIAKTNNSAVLSEELILTFQDIYANNRYEGSLIFMEDLNGSCLDTSVYSEYDFRSMRNVSVIELVKDEVPSLYTSKPVKEICNNCYLDPSTNDQTDFIIVNPDATQPYFEVWNENMKNIFDEQFLSVFYSEQGQYFVVLDKSHQIRFIRRSEANLPKVN